MSLVREVVKNFDTSLNENLDFDHVLFSGGKMSIIMSASRLERCPKSRHDLLRNNVHVSRSGVSFD